MSDLGVTKDDNIEKDVTKPSRRTLLDFVRQQPLGSLGIVLIITMMLAAIFAQHVAPFNPEDVDFEASPAFGGGAPSLAHHLVLTLLAEIFYLA
jgi:hypothetical protein